MSLLVGLPLGIFRLLGSLLLIVLRFGWPLLLVFVAVRVARRLRNGPAPKKEPKKAREPEFHGPVYTVDYEDVDDPSEPEPPEEGTP